MSRSSALVLVLAVGCADADADADAGDAASDTGAEVTEGGEGASTGDADGDGRELPVDLVWPELWVADPGADFVPAHAPGVVECDAGFGDEIGLFEVDTGLCNYGVFSQPLADQVYAGERVEFVFTHDDLTAPTPAVGHIAIAIDGETVWEIEVAIPKPYDIVQGEWIADRGIAAGTVVTLHLHNHGYNNWRVVSFKAGAQ
jgi:hypothetical protein